MLSSSQNRTNRTARPFLRATDGGRALLVGLLALILSATALSPREAPAQPTAPTDAFSGLISVTLDSFLDPAPEVVSYSPNSTTKLCFASRESLIGDEELFCYDGSALRQVSQGLEEIEDLTLYNGTLYFTAENDEYGTELWRYDGASVELVDDIDDGTDGAFPSDLAVYDGSLYFQAESDLWRYDSGDGSAIRVDNNGLNPEGLTVYDGSLYFQGDGGSDGEELWHYTSGEASASLVKDINTGSSGSRPEGFTVYNGFLYFEADDGSSGSELRYINDEGILFSFDINSGSGDSNPEDLTVYDGALYFSADGGSDGAELWRYEKGTLSASQVDDINSGADDSGVSNLAVYNGALYFSAVGGDGAKLFRYTSGDASATAVDSPSPIGPPVVSDLGSGPQLYYPAVNLAGNRLGLHRFDGSTVTAETSTAVDTAPTALAAYQGALYFGATSGDGVTGLWKYEAGAVSLVKDELRNVEQITEYDGALYFRALSENAGTELWTSDGTTSGTQLVEDINPTTDSDGNPRSSFPQDFAVYNGNLFFGAETENSGDELYRYDGSSVVLIEDIDAGSGSSRPTDLTVYDGSLYFAADGAEGRELYRSDGPNATRVTDINSGSNNSNPTDLAVYNGQLYFQATDGDPSNGNSGAELYVYGGSQAQLVEDLNTSGNASPANLTVYDGALYFQATGDGVGGPELYRLNGALVEPVADINPEFEEGSSPRDFAVYNNRLYFTAYTPTDGREPHSYDGSSVTSIDLHPGAPSGGGLLPVVYDDGSGPALYAFANDGQAGTELFRFDQNTAPLPVELASFEAIPADDRAVDLAWTTASETGNVGFRVQHKRVEPSGDSDGWTTIGRREGAGTTSQPQSYTFTAEDLSVGSHTFRLRQVDADGSVHPTDPVTVDLRLQQRARLGAPAPNPVRQRAQIEFAVRTTQPVTLTLYNVLGQKVQVLHDGVVPGNSPTTATLRVDQLAGGAYFVRLQTDTSTKTRRLTVVR